MRQPLEEWKKGTITLGALCHLIEKPYEAKYKRPQIACNCQWGHSEAGGWAEVVASHCVH